MFKDRFKRLLPYILVFKAIKWIVVLALFAYSSFASAQDGVPTAQDYANFFNSKTLVVMDNNPMSDFNFKIKEVMESTWKLTKFDFIPSSEYEAKRRDPGYSFLLVTTVTFDKDDTKARYSFLSLLMGKDVFRETDMPDICSVPLSYVRVDEESYIYKLEAFVRFAQEHAKLMSANPDLISKMPFKYYNKNIKDLKGKKLLLVESDLAPSLKNEAKLKKLYPYEVEIVTKEEVEEAISRRDPNVVFLHKVGPEGTKFKARCYKILVGAADSQFYYFDYHMVSTSEPDAISEKDIKRMGSK